MKREMWHYFLKHVFEYTLVLMIITTAIIALYLLPDSRLRKTAIIGVAAIYPLWAFCHHSENDSLDKETVLEYIAFTILLFWTLLVTV